MVANHSLLKKLCGSIGIEDMYEGIDIMEPFQPTGWKGKQATGLWLICAAKFQYSQL